LIPAIVNDYPLAGRVLDAAIHNGIPAFDREPAAATQALR
jgi:hypothetical protein